MRAMFGKGNARGRGVDCPGGAYVRGIMSAHRYRRLVVFFRFDLCDRNKYNKFTKKLNKK